MIENSDHPRHLVVSLMARVQQNVSRYFITSASAPEREANFRWLFLSEAASPACDGPLDEESYADRHNRYYVLAEALAAELAQRQDLDPRTIYVLIDPSGWRGEGTLYVAYLYTPDPRDLGQAVLLYACGVTAGLRFDHLSQFEAYLWEQYTQLERGYARAVARPVPAIPSTP